MERKIKKVKQNILIDINDTDVDGLKQFNSPWHVIPTPQFSLDPQVGNYKIIPELSTPLGRYSW